MQICLLCVCVYISTHISEVQCSSASGEEAGGRGHLALANRPASHTHTHTPSATWDTHSSSHCEETAKETQDWLGRSLHHMEMRDTK